MKRVVAIAIVTAVLGGFAFAAHERATAQDRAEAGRAEFVRQGCHGCHTIGKLGTPIGPDLSRVGAKYSESYLRAWLRDPAMQRPAAHMPALELTNDQIAALAAFLAKEATP